MYRLWAQDGGLAGARFDDGIANYNVVESDLKDANDKANKVALSADNEKALLAVMGYGEDVTSTTANEKGAFLKVAGDYYSIGTLLGGGAAEPVGGGVTIVEKARVALSAIRGKAADQLRIFDEPSQSSVLQSGLNALWADAQEEVDNIFGTEDGKVRVALDANPRYNNRVLDDLDDMISALESEAAFAAATAKNGNGVFEDAELGTGPAGNAFNAQSSESSVRLGRLGDMRFGAVYKKVRASAVDPLTYKYNQSTTDDVLGAFAYSTINKETRTRNIQLAGSASYEGKTQAVDGKGNFVSGDIELQVRFDAEKVSGQVSNLKNDADRSDWQYLYSNVSVDTITLPEADLRSGASWSEDDKARVDYATTAGLPRPVSADGKFTGQLLKGGTQAIGTWTFGENPESGKNFLAGSFGAERASDLPDLRPDAGDDDGTSAQTKALPYDVTNTAFGDGSATDTDTRGQQIAGGELVIIGQQYGQDGAVVTGKYRTHKIKLAEKFASPGEKTWSTAAKHTAGAITTLKNQRALFASGLNLTNAQKTTAWTAVRNALANKVFNISSGNQSNMPGLFASDYASATRDSDYVRAIDDAIDALGSGDALKSALTVPTGIFYKESSTNTGSADNDAATANKLDDLFGIADKDVDLTALGGVVGRFASRVEVVLGSTSFARFGAWRRQTSESALDGYNNRTETNAGDGPNAFAYSPLSATEIGSKDDDNYPGGSTLRYTGETVAVQHTKFFTGEITVEVAWKPTEVGGTLAAVITNLEDLDTGDPMYYDADTTSNDAIRLPEVRQIVFNAVEVDSDLKFSGASTPSSVASTVGAAPVAMQPGTFEGKFVGIGLDGPLAVLGAWSAGSDGNVGAEKTTKNDDGVVTERTVFTQAIHGAFGAELP